MLQLLKTVRDYLCYFRWILKGRPIPVDHVFKEKRIRLLSKRYRCRTFVETGTFYGQMVEAVRKDFPLVLSIELSDSLYRCAKRKFSKCNNVHLFHGDSETDLGKMVQMISGRAIFWLDGHYSGPGTAKGQKPCPIMGELNSIGEHRCNDHCILIDDARCFNGLEGYPTCAEVKAKLLEINNDYEIATDYDCIMALPQTRIAGQISRLRR